MLVDGDLQFGDVPLFLNQQVNVTMTDLVPHVDRLDGELLQEALLGYANGFKILAASPAPELAETISLEVFDKILEHLQRHYAYVVVDTGAELNDVTATALEKVDVILAIA